MARWLIILALIGVASAWINSTPTNMLRVSHAATAWIDVDNNAKPDLFASGSTGSHSFELLIECAAVTGAIASNLALLKNAGNYRFSDVSQSLPSGSTPPFTDGTAISADFDNVHNQRVFLLLTCAGRSP